LISFPESFQSGIIHVRRFFRKIGRQSEIELSEVARRRSSRQQQGGRKSSSQRACSIERRGRGKIIGYQEHRPLLDVHIGGRFQQGGTKGRVITSQHG
jgi:hypothetical protein